MKIIIKKALKKEKQTDKFYSEAHKYLQKRFHKTLQELSADSFEKQTLKLTPLEGGSISILYKFQFSQQIRVVRITEDPLDYWSNIHSFKICTENNILTPKLLYYNQDAGLYITISEFIPYKTVFHINRSSQDLKIFYQLGKTLAKLHNIKLEGYGPIYNNTGDGKHPTFKREINDIYSMLDFVQLKKHNILTTDEISKIKTWKHDLKKYPENLFIHGDYFDDNTFYNTQLNKVIIFDFNGRVSTRYFDLAHYYYKKLSTQDDHHWAAFKKGYLTNGQFNNDLLEKYTTLFFLSRLWIWKVKGMKKKYSKGMNFINNII